MALTFDAHAGVLSLDVETCSAHDITYGAWAYSQHPSTRVHCAVFGYATGPRAPRTYVRWFPGRRLPAAILDYLAAGGVLIAHNAAFEKSICANILTPRHGWPIVPTEQWRDTQAMAQAVNLPRSLAGLCKALGVPHQKDAEGAALMMELAVATPQPGGGWDYPPVSPAQLRRLSDYCKADVAATLDAYFALPKLSVQEHLTWLVDQRTNERGALLDQAFAGKLRRMAEARQQVLEREVRKATTSEVSRSTAAPALMSWLKYRGVVLPKRTRKKKNGSYHKTETIDKLAVVELLRGELPDDVRQMLRNRAEASKAASLAKLNRVEPMVGTDGRLRFALNYCGAHTGRWTSEGLQLHNLPKNQLTAAASALVRDLVEAEDPQGLEMVEARPLEALSQMLRSVVVAPPGRELIGADFSAIEARVCAWLAGQDDVTAFFHEFDAQRRAGGKPKDFYVFTAESIDSDERQLGKVAALALQYGMGDVTFAGTAAKWGVPLTLLRARQVKLSWRLANRCIAQWWRDLEDAAFAAVLEPGSRHRAGRVSFRSTGKVLLMRLPSGRCIRYWQPSIVLKTRVFQLVDDEGKQVQKSVTREELQFWKPARGAMVAETTYGGKLCVAAGTKVFTGRGWVPIQNVLSDDLVHDGVEFVRHGGKVFNGEKQCCSVDGVLMTRDHEVLTDEGWQAASQDPRPIRLPLWLLDGAETGSQRRQKAFLALSLRLRKAESQGRIRRAAGVEARRNAELRLQDRSADRSGEHQARHDRAPDLLGVALDARPVPAPDASVLEELRRSGDTSLSPVARLREFPGGYVADLSRGLVDRAPRQQPRVQPRELHVGDAGRSSVQPAKQRVRPIEGKTPYRGADGPRNGDRRDDSALSDRARLASDEAADASGPDEPRRVFDIQNCGPRQRFVVLGVRGPFLVHNCENAVQAVARELLAAGLVQLDGVAPYELVIHVHDSAAAEVPEGMGDPVDFADRLAAAPPWVAGCPVAAEGWRDRRFRG